MKYDEVMMKTAELFAKQSYCKRRKVGAVVAKDGRAIITAYNGTISGLPNCCEEFIYVCRECGADVTKNIEKHQLNCPKCGKNIAVIDSSFTSYGDYSILANTKNLDKTNEFTIHAEQNAICFAAKKGISLENTTMYCTTSPCKSCAKLIAQSGISKVVYKDIYKDTSGLDFLEKCGVKVERVANENQDK